MDDLIREFAEARNTLPVLAIGQALVNWPEAAPPLLALLEAYADGSDRSEASTNASFFALMLVGAAREKRAYPAVCRLAHDTEAIRDALGDGVTEALNGILIGTFDGDVSRLRGLILDPAADEFVRGAALEAMAWLAAAGTLPMATMADCLRDLHDALRDAPEAFYLWAPWQEAIGRLGLVALRPLVEAAYADDLIDPTLTDMDLFEADLREGLAPDIDRVALLAREHIAPIDDVVARLEHWASFQGPEDELPFLDPPQPVVNPLRGVGRNDPCPCGSGKKFKKCCLGL